MSDCTVYDFKVKQGATFTKSISMLGGGKICKLVEDLTPGCPTLITITGHGLPAGGSMPVFISHVKGATRANTAAGKAVTATYVDANSFFIDADTVQQDYTAGTGLLTYYAPTDLTNYTARMHIRDSVDSDVIIDELTTANGDISIDTTFGKVTFTIHASVSETYDFDFAVYDLELVDDSVEPVVTRLAEGEIELCKEVTR